MRKHMNGFSISGPFPSRKAFQVLRDRLIAHLIESGAAVGDDFCSDSKLMDASGLSRTTVRKAVDDLCSAGWVERRAGVGTFVGPRVALPQPPQPAANGKTVQRRETVRVAVLLHLQRESGVDYFTRGVLQGLDSAALEEGLSVELVGGSNLDVASLVKRLNHSRTDVLVVMPATGRHALQAGAAESLGIPCLVAGTHLYESGLPTVQDDGEQGAALAVHHLVERGHRRIGLWLSQAPTIWVHQRRNGYLQALRDLGIEPDERKVLWTPYSPVNDNACETQLNHVGALQRYLKEQRPTALILGSSGQHTRTLGEAVRKRLVRIPEDLSVVCMDQNYEDYSLFLHRRPPVVAIPLVEMGRTLARLASAVHSAKIQGAALPTETISLPWSLVEGDSVAACASAKRR
jgi:DNA-binding LacI/PurR family transcriptional regulator